MSVLPVSTDERYCGFTAGVLVQGGIWDANTPTSHRVEVSMCRCVDVSMCRDVEMSTRPVCALRADHCPKAFLPCVFSRLQKALARMILE